MAIWHWVRHGPTHAKTFVGWRDLPADLSDTALIGRVSDALPCDAPVVCSDLQRAMQTADALAGDRTRLPAQPGLREFHFGSWDGRPFDDIAARDPDLSRRYWENPGPDAPPGGESWDEAAHRVATTVCHLDRSVDVPEIIAVAHIGVILTQVQRITGSTPQEAIGNKIDNLSVTSLDMAAGAVLRLNYLP